MIMGKIFINRKVLIPILILAAIVPVVAADVIYYYSGVVNVYSTASPLIIKPGPNGVVPLPSGEKGYYINVTTTPANSFTANINITNSSYDYFYEAVTLKASSALNLFITNVTYSYSSSSSPINNAWIVIESSTGSYDNEFQVISAGSVVSSTSPITLTAGTYYIGILIQPNTPLPPPSSSVIATFTVYFGDNVVGASSVPLPPT